MLLLLYQEMVIYDIARNS